MSWDNLSLILKQYYIDKGLLEVFEEDEKYLSKSFNDIESIWTKNYNSIDKIKFVMISEAPLWGEKRKFIYNPEINNSQYFYRSDLEYVLNQRITNKVDFINKLRQIGLIIIDISPFAFNKTDTEINYREISKSDYRRLLKETLPIYFSKKLELIKNKKNDSVQFFYRYSRVRKAFNKLISEIIIEKGLVESENEILDISQNGGGISRVKLNEIINNAS